VGWLYYKIYAEDTTNWYYKILNEVVKPFVQQNSALIDKSFFFHYEENYPIQPEPNCERKFEAGVKVRYVRLRVRAKDEHLSTLENSLLSLIMGSQTVLEKEKCPFDVEADLGERFGHSRTELAVNYLDAFAQMVLSLLTSNNQLENGDKPSSAIHLVHNMIGSSIPVACANVNCRAINQVNLIIPFECQVCHTITYLL
jgi:HPt (histidine-containing phosphotransfer) domain-containing protein